MESRGEIQTKILLNKANARRRKLKLPGLIVQSQIPTKKLTYISPEGKRVHFGADGSHTFLEGATKEKRKDYRARHKKIMLKDGTPAYKKKLSPAWLSWNILW